MRNTIMAPNHAVKYALRNGKPFTVNCQVARYWRNTERVHKGNKDNS